MAVIFSIPATQLVGEWLYKDKGFQFYQPLQGGAIFVAFQAFGWATYAFSLFGVACWLVFRPRWGGLITLSGVLGCVAQVLIECSLLTFKLKIDKDESRCRLRSRSSGSTGGSSRRRANSAFSTRSGKSENWEAEGLERDVSINCQQCMVLSLVLIIGNSSGWIQS